MTRSLLLKGLAGVAALGGTVGGLAVYRKEIFGGWGKAPEEPKSEDVSKFSQKDLIDKVGLNCGLTGDDIGEETKDCSVKDNGSINIKKREQEEEGVTFTGNGSTKLKVSKNEEKGSDETDKYTKKLKFVVDSGDLTLTKKEGGGTATTIQKLEQFETYEIFLKNDGKFYLRRKTDAKEEKIKALGLPSGCTLPESGDSNCSLDAEKIKAVKFEGQSQGVTVSTGTVNLKISKMSDSTDFTDGYRFTFTFPGDVTINSKNIKTNTPYDFKIKKGTGNTLSLEKAWTDDNTFTKKAGLDCSSNQNECNVSSTDPKLNVKVGDKTREGISNISTGKIKRESDQAGYNQGLKFTITTGDISLTDGTGDAQVTKLEELETYEITEDKGKYYLTRKATKEENIKSSLVLPQGCNLPTGAEVQCNLSPDDFKAINFEGKSEPSASGTVTLKISKGANTTDFPLGYKFTLQSEQEITIKSDNKVKANIPTDFKIKKEEGKVSLEKAWSEFSFAEKVGLNCTTQSGDTCCTKSGSPDINVKKGTETKTGITSFSASTGSSAKIKVEKDKEGYNQGLKFTVTGGSVTLTGGTGSGSFTTLDEYETYEIKEEGDKYYLTRRDEAIKTIESQLGLTAAGCSLSTSSPSCSLTSDKLQKINFDGKNNPSIASNGTATLTITSGANKTDFPNGYKFTLQSEKEITIKTDDKVAAKIPTDFKIKKPTASGSLSLEKAWTVESLGKKVGLTCNNSNSSDECTITNGGNQLKVKQLSENDNEIKQKSLTKKTNGASGNNGKIKVTKDQEGYNQGFKFEISDGIIELDGTTGNDEGEKITRLGEYETYEIKEEGTDWYLSIKDKADVFVLKQLGLDNIGNCTSLKLPRDSSGDNCRIQSLDDLKKIKFENATGHTWSGTVSKDNEVELEIKQDSNLPAGFKFTFTDSDGKTGVCLPDGSGGKVSLKNNSSGVDYKIKKTGSGSSATLTLERHNGSGGSSSGCK